MSSQEKRLPHDQAFEIEEATIATFHTAIRSGEVTVLSVVQRYIERVRAFNGVASMLVTEDGKDIDEVEGVVRGTDPLRFPVRTMRMSDLLPDLDLVRIRNVACGGNVGIMVRRPIKAVAYLR